MNDLRKAAEMALQYFEEAYGLEDAEVEIKEALRQALNVDNVDMSEERVYISDKSIHEPVAWMKEWEDGHINLWLYKPTMFYEAELQPLYTALPQREWVGLADDEIAKYWGDAFAGNTQYVQKFARAIEAKLKEKNSPESYTKCDLPMSA